MAPSHAYILVSGANEANGDVHKYINRWGSGRSWLYIYGRPQSPGVGFSRPEWNEIRAIKTGTVERTLVDDTLPDGPRERTIVYEAPFDRCDREKDYEIAWAEFERRFK